MSKCLKSSLNVNNSHYIISLPRICCQQSVSVAFFLNPETVQKLGKYDFRVVKILVINV